MKHKQKQVNIIILILLIFLSFTTSTSIASKNQVTSNHNNTFSHGTLLLSQFLPHVYIINATLITDTPEDGSLLQLEVFIKNNDNISYTDLNLLVNATKYDLTVQRLGLNKADNKGETVANYTISLIEANQIKKIFINFALSYGQYQLTCYLVSQGIILPKALYSIPVDVLNKPVGDDETLIIALSSSVALLVLLIYVPSLIDVFKVNHSQNKKDKES